MSRIVFLPVVALLLHPVALPAQGGGSDDEQVNQAFIKSARAGGPGRIADEAAVARLEPDGKVTRVREGSNGFTCTILPDGNNSPFCGDEHAFAWIVAAMSKQPEPPNTQPGVAYMAKGGMHFETPDGEIVMERSAGTKDVKEPPHWMLLWPLDPATSGLPTRPNAGGSYIMFAGTPYAHLMVYQDPKKLKP